MKQFSIQPAREGVTKYIATIESFENDNEDNQGEAFEFESLDEAIKAAAPIARNRKGNVLIIESRNSTNSWCHGHSYTGICIDKKLESSPVAKSNAALVVEAVNLFEAHHAVVSEAERALEYAKDAGLELGALRKAINDLKAIKS